MDPFTAFIINLVIGLVISAASSLIQGMMAQDKNQVSGVRGTIQTGGDNPIAFIMGFYGTAGHLKYAGAWGNDGETPNAYLTKVVTVSDLPIRSYAGWFVNGERVTLAGAVTGDLGYAVLEYRVDGKDHMWIRPYLGGQTTADPLMRTNFGSDPDRPYTDTMIGRGQAYFVATALQNRELFANLPEYFAEVNGLALDDPRGDGAHDNPIVGIYTLLQGIYYDGVWVYGPQSITTNRLPSGNWEAQMDKCDALIDGRKRFRFGLEVSVDQEPHAIIGELLKACEGRIAEIGGTYKVLVGEPDAPVVSITDEDIVITEGQSYEPFPGLEATFNGVTATYPEPEEAWESKEAPPRYRSDLELLDDNRRLPFSTDYKAVPFPVQVQALMRAAIEETRRFRRHTKTMPPEWWEFEPLDAYAWSSERNGYVNKLFLITAMDDLPNGNQFVGDQEIDPADYDWSSDYELPWDVAPLVIARPAPQEVSGFYVEPAIALDSEGRPRRPAIDAFWSAASVTVDVRAVRISVRLDDGDVLEWEGEAPRPELGSARLTEALLRKENYEVQIEYVPFSGRVTVASSWLKVTTPDVGLGPLDFDPFEGVVGFDMLGEDLAAFLARMGVNQREFFEQQQALAILSGDQDLANAATFNEVRREVSTAVGNLSASFTEVISVQVTPINGRLTAISDVLTQLSAGDGTDISTARWRMTAIDGPTGYATLQGEARVTSAASYRTASFGVDVPVNVALPSRFWVDAEQFIVKVGTTSIDFFIVDGAGLHIVNAFIKNLNAGNIDVAALTATSGFFDNFEATWAQIDTAVVNNFVAQTGNIGNLAVDTLNVKAGAISTVYSAVAASNVNFTPSFVIIPATVPVPVIYGQVIVQFMLILGSSGSAGGNFYYEYRKNGVALYARSVNLGINDEKTLTYNYNNSAPGSLDTYDISVTATGGYSTGTGARAGTSVLAINNKRQA